MSFEVRPSAGGANFAVRVQPGAKREGIVGIHGDAVKIALSAPAVDGKANDALIRYLADLLQVPRLSIEILSGALTRSKVIRVNGITPDEVAAKLMQIESA